MNATRCSELLAVRADLSDRKLRLFAVACCRAMAHLFTEDWQEEALHRIEAIAESSKPWSSCSGLRGLDKWSRWLWQRSGWYLAPEWSQAARVTETAVYEAIVETARWSGGREAVLPILGNVVTALIRHAADDAGRNEHTHQLRFAGLLREIAGNPFALVTFDPAWRTTTGAQLARYADDTRDFSVLPILADALQDAGSDDEELLGHLRDPFATHVRGCWALDLVAGKG